jgi:glycosyltransferase involved in cell wall biosynthesis
VVESYRGQLPLRYVFEPVQGLSAARNRALREFRGDMLVFTDDDVVLDENWLPIWFRGREKFPDAAYFGGRILPLWEGNKPRWLVDPNLSLISGLLVNYDLGVEDRWFMERDPLPFGANFALRRRLIECLEPFRIDLGVRGKSSGRGEEGEYLSRARAASEQGAYIGSAICYHTQDLQRFTIPYLYRFGIEKGRTEILLGRDASGSLQREATFVLRGFLQLLKGRGDRFRQCVINAGIQRGLRRYFEPHRRKTG